jgi:putative ABC transport system permease protein
MILWRASFRYLWRHPLQILFAVLGVALGVAVVVAIDLANSSADRAFRLSADALTGRTSHQLVGGPDGLPEEIYRQLRLSGQWPDSAPVVEGFAAVPAQPGLTLRILGVDPFAEGPFRSYSPAIGRPIDFSRLLGEPATGLMTAATARSLGLQIDDVLPLSIAGATRDLTLIGFLRPTDQVAQRALENLVLVDIATAQELLGRLGKLSRVDLILPEGAAGEKKLAGLQQLLPENVQLIGAGNRTQSMAQMTRAFQLNLTALSLLALVVGMFLIYNTMTFSVLQRRTLLGALRTLGVTRRELFSLVLVEALLVGVAGTALGLLLGLLLANGLLELVTRTINDLYFVLNVSSLALSPLSLAKGLLLGIGATLAAALMPAVEAAGAAPRSVLSRATVESRRRKLLPWGVGLGLGLMTASLAGLLVPSKSIAGSFLLMFMLILGYALLTPGMAVWLLRHLQPLLKKTFGLLGKMAARNLVAGLSRTGVATAALVIAVAATVGVGLMIGSFRVTVADWLQSYLRADIYVTTASSGFGPGRTPLKPALLEQLNKLDGIASITRARHLSLEAEDGFSELFIAEIPAGSFAGYWFKEGDNETIYQQFEKSAAVIVSEPYAYHRNLQRGDKIELRTDQGPQSFQIAGVFTDYGSDQGRITMSRRLYEKYWSDPQTDALGIYLAAGVDSERLAEQVRTVAADFQQLLVYSNHALREASMATFDRTFAVTSVLRMLG